MIVSIREFPKHTKPIVSQQDKKEILPSIYQEGWKDLKHHTQMHLKDLPSLPHIALVVPTANHNLTIVDFDVQEDFDTALLLNNALLKEEQCQYIVKSSRKGGHFYYLPTEGINPLHTQKSVKVDILTIGNNAIAPTQCDPSKEVIVCGAQLTSIHPLMLHYLNSLILAQSATTEKKIYLTARESHSDDNHLLVEDFILNRINPQLFYDYYNIPERMPEGESYNTLQKLAYRLLSDETIPHNIVLQTLDKYDPEHRQNHSALAPATENKYVKDKDTYTLTMQHSDYKTPINVYLDRHTGDHIVQYSEHDGEPRVLSMPVESRAKNLIEKMVQVKKSRINWHRIRDVKVESTYTKKGGFNYDSRTFNKSYINTYLKAFKGTKPEGYEVPSRFIQMLKHMWGEEFDYLLSHTKYRYNTFTHSPVLHHIVGVEGSGKNTTEVILNKGFSEDSQELDYNLFMDKHSNHQTLPNTVLGEVGNWNKIQIREALAKVKTMTGNQGKVTIRGMQQMPLVVPTINKIWVLGNNWIKLHDNPVTQRRVHAVYMPHPLSEDFGGPYSVHELEELMSSETIVNFYYWLGNEYSTPDWFTKAEYMSASCRQNSPSYKVYLDSVEGKADRIIKLIAEQDYEKLLEAVKLVEKDFMEVEFKYNKQGLLVVSIMSLKMLFMGIDNADLIYRALQDINAQKENSKLLRFNGSPEKYITVFGAPAGLGTVAAEEFGVKR
jgi:hypothetical protein